MGSADWLKNVIGMRKAKDGRSKKIKVSCHTCLVANAFSLDVPTE